MEPKEQGSLLIIDDSEINRAIISNIFIDKYQVEEAEDGVQGLQMILHHTGELRAVLLDIVMPRMNGIEVLRQLKHHDLLDKIPIFIITADPDAETVREAYELGVMDVILKPVVPYIIKRRVDSVIELFLARRRLGAEVERQRDKLLEQARQLAELGMGMVEALATAIEFRSDESGKHVQRIHDITCCVLRSTQLGDGLTEEQIQMIGVASITHDVGKISVPDAILNKQGRLTPEEFEIMKRHAADGAKLLRSIPQMRAHASFEYAYDIALHHHERWDGRGYPDGLVGDQTPIWTQVVSLADVYDALVSKRCYKDAYSADTAMQMILEGQCGAFNPKLLQCFQEVEPMLRWLYQ